LGSIPGAYVAALLLGLVKALCIGLGTVEFGSFSFSFSKLTLVVEFLVMAGVLVWRPWGLLGSAQAGVSHSVQPEAPLRRPGSLAQALTLLSLLALALLPWWAEAYPYALVLGIDLCTAALFAASLHFIMGPGGLHSFGHAAYFGLGAYGAAWLLQGLGLPMELALLGAPLLAALVALGLGWFSVRLSGIYLAMLTLAFAQIIWAICYQWDGVTGGSNGLTGLWPASWLANRTAYYGLALGLTALSAWLLRRLLFAPFGFALRAARDSAVRAESIGLDVKRVQWLAFAVAGLFAGLAGAVAAFSKGSISPELFAVGKSVDGLVMVLLGGVQTLAGPLVGAAVFTGLQDSLARSTEYWRAMLGGVILLLVLLFPQGLVGTLSALFSWAARRGRSA
jgi:branched-chain amino acid transport system permease protein